MAANPMTQFEVYRIGPEIKIANELTTMNKLAFVNEISNAPIFISGPIL